MRMGMEGGGGGFRFVPSDELLVQFLVDKIKHVIEHEGVSIRELDLYGNESP